MNDRQFFNKVVEMRRLQKEYFKSRDRAILEMSKAVEREIDTEIKSRQDNEAEIQQYNLF